MSEENKTLNPAATPETSTNSLPAATPVETPPITGGVAPAVGINVNIPQELQGRLAQYGADTATIARIVTDLGVESLEDLAVMEDKDLVAAGMKLAKVRRMLAELNKTTQPVAQPATSAAGLRGPMIPSYEDILPDIPDDGAWLGRLKTDGVLKVEDSTYIAAVRAALADQVGLYDVPDRLIREMDAYAEVTDEQVGSEYFELREMLARRSYADLFSAVKGLNGSYITDKRRKAFLQKLQAEMWPALKRGNNALESWNQVYRENSNDLGNIALVLQGQGDMVAIADTSSLHEAGDDIIMSINRAFSGTGVQVSAALAYDACEIIKALNNPRLPMLIGVPSRELMLKKIGISVSGGYVRQERNLVRFVMAFVNHNAVSADAETHYFKALWQLGSQIDWPQLPADVASRSSGSAKRRTVNELSGRPSSIEL